MGSDSSDLENQLASAKAFTLAGSGQLAAMLSLSARRLGLQTNFVSENKGPASFLEHPTDASKTTTLIAESEFPDQSLVLGLENEDFVSIPNWDLLKTIRDKRAQKSLFVNLGLPTAPFLDVPLDLDLTELKSLARQNSLLPGMLKWSLFGYDGHGCLELSESTTEARWKEFSSLALQKGAQIYLEKKISFIREVAIVSAITRDGLFSYPLIQTKQKHGACFEAFLAGPMPDALKDFANSVYQRTKIRGVFALELFEDQDNKFWINEMAPRVHNSGHLSWPALGVDQFELHWASIKNLSKQPLKRPRVAYMRNFLGQKNRVLPRRFDVRRFAEEKFEVLWVDYGKTQEREGRKMGHVCLWSDSNKSNLEIAQKKADKLEKFFWNPKS